MKITHKTEQAALETVILILPLIGESRFTCEIRRKGRTVSFHNIRLRSSKEYCGNHPAGCEGDPNKRDRKARFLEGADWVEFDDMLNDCLDARNVDANVSSSLVTVRRGRCRRIRYDKGTFTGIKGINGAWTWDKDGKPGDFLDCCGKQAPDSWFPEGTPGTHSRIGYSCKG